VIDMRYENPYYMRKTLGCGSHRRRPTAVGYQSRFARAGHRGLALFGYSTIEGEDDAAMGRRHTEEFLELLRGKGFARPTRVRCFPIRRGFCALSRIPRIAGSDLVGSASNATAAWAAKLGMNLQTSTSNSTRQGSRSTSNSRADPLLPRSLEGGRPHSHAARLGQPQYLRFDRRPRSGLFRTQRSGGDQIGFLDETTRAIFGRSYAAEPDVLIEQLKKDEAIAEADTLLLTVPNQLGVAYNAHVMEAILTTVAPALGWR